MNHLATTAVAAALLALATTAWGWRGWGEAPAAETRHASAAAQEATRPVSDAPLQNGGEPSWTGYGGYADARTAGTAYYGWSYPFALPFPAALAAAYSPETTKP